MGPGLWLDVHLLTKRTLFLDKCSPMGWLMMSMAESTASILCRGSPMPMKTRLVTGVVSPSEAKRRLD